MSWFKLSGLFMMAVLVGTISCWDSSRHWNGGRGRNQNGGLNIPTTPPFNPHIPRQPVFNRFKREVNDQQALADLEEYHQINNEAFTLEKQRVRRNYIRPTYRPPPTKPSRPIRMRREDHEHQPLVDLEETYNTRALEQLRFRRHYVKPTYPTIKV